MRTARSRLYTNEVSIGQTLKTSLPSQSRAIAFCILSITCSQIHIFHIKRSIIGEEKRVGCGIHGMQGSLSTVVFCLILRLPCFGQTLTELVYQILLAHGWHFQDIGWN